jgi:hypothetical protein
LSRAGRPAAGAREAAAKLPDREATWPPVQQMYGRLSEANHLLDQFRHLIDEAVKKED